LIGTVVILNSLMLFIVSPSFNAFLGKLSKTKEGKILSLVLIEHILLIGIAISKVIIPDIPGKILQQNTARLVNKKETKVTMKGGASEREKALKTIHDYSDAREIKAKGRLSDFIPIDAREFFADEKANEIN